MIVESHLTLDGQVLVVDGGLLVGADHVVVFAERLNKMFALDFATQAQCSFSRLRHRVRPKLVAIKASACHLVPAISVSV